MSIMDCLTYVKIVFITFVIFYELKLELSYQVTRTYIVEFYYTFFKLKDYCGSVSINI